MKELIEHLNKNYQENPEAVIEQGSEEEHFDSLCAECLSKTKERSISETRYCPNCQTIEGDTYEVTSVLIKHKDETVRVSYNWDTKTWSEYDENTGLIE